MQGSKPTTATPGSVPSLVARAPTTNKPVNDKKPKNRPEILEVPDVEIGMEEWRMCATKLKPGADIKIKLTLRNLGSRAITDKLSIRVDKDAFFQATTTLVNRTIPPAGDIQVDVTLKVKGGVCNLNTLPRSKEVMLVKDLAPGKLAKLASTRIEIPIEPFIRHLKEEFPPLRIMLWGLFGTGKSSFINSVATLFNEDPRFPNKKLNPAFSRPATGTVTTELKQYKFNNVTMGDTWGWEEADKSVYSDLIFQLMLAGKLGNNFTMESAKKMNVLSLPTSTAEPVDLVLFFVTVASVANEAYLNQLNHFIKEAQKLKIPFLVLLTQIDKVEPSLKQDPYCLNPTIQDLTNQVCLKIELDESYVVPVVNYTREPEKTWEMDRAAFVTLFRAFQARDDSRAADGV